MRALNLPRVSAFTIFLLLVLTGCNAGKSSDVTSQVPSDPVHDQYDPAAINIGAIAVNPSIRNAILLGARDVNSAGGVLGRNFNVVAFVGKDTNDSVILAKSLLKYDIKMMGVSYSSRSLAVSKLTIPAKIPLISESATSTVFTNLNDNDFYFRVAPSDVYQGQVLAQIAADAGKTRAVTIYNTGDAYGDTLTSEFKTDFEALGGKVLARIAIPFNQTSGFDTALKQIETLQPDVIVNVILDAGIAANFQNEMAFFNINALTIVPDSSAGLPAFIDSAANINTIDGTLGTSPGFGPSSNSETKFFRQRYLNTYGYEPQSYNAQAYDMVLITALAIERAGVVNHTNNPTGLMVRDSLRPVLNPPGTLVGPSNLDEALRLIQNGQEVDYSGAYGNIDWDKNGDIAGDITYTIFRVDAKTSGWVVERQLQIHVPLVP